MFKTNLDVTNVRHRKFVFRMNLLIKNVALNGSFNRIENMWQYRWLDTCLHDQEFELCISLVTGHIIWTFCLMSRNTLAMHRKEIKISTEYVAMPL
jgi:hypothetical protein